MWKCTQDFTLKSRINWKKKDEEKNALDVTVGGPLNGAIKGTALNLKFSL